MTPKNLKRSAVIATAQIAVLGLFPASSLAATFELEEATIADINRAFNAGALTSESLTQLYLNRIAAYDKQGPAFNSIISLNPDALQIARELDLERQTTGARSPLHGIPILLKDNFDTFDLPTTAGATVFKDFVPTRDAFQVQRLRDAGAIILGKTNLSEFAFSGGSSISSLGGTTRNAYDPLRTPAGSSGGTATAIAANFAAIGFGTDTGGSIRNPASVSSLVGLRPTIGLTSRSGIVPLALSQDVGGPMTRTVADAAIALDITAGFDPTDPVTASSIGKIPTSYTRFLDRDGLQGARIGVARELFGLDTNPEAAKVNAVINQAIADLQLLGAEVVDNVTIPNLTQIVSSPSLSAFEFKSNLNDYLASHPNAPVKTLTEIIDSGGYLPSNRNTLIARNNVGPLETNAEYQAIIQNRPGLTQQSLLTALNLLDNDSSNDLDALIYPTNTFPPGLISPPSNLGSNSRPSPFSGFPAITVPAGFTPDNLPIGLEFLGPAFSEGTLFKLTYAYEQGTQNRRPSPFAPALPGEVIEYETVPEPGAVFGLGLLGMGMLGVRVAKRQKRRKEDGAIANIPDLPVTSHSSLDTSCRSNANLN